MQQRQTGWARIIEVIDKPLVLALLIVEAFLSTVLIFSDLNPGARERGMWAIVLLFVFVVGIVSLLVWHKPTHLTFTGFDSLVESGRASFGTYMKPVSGDELPTGTLPSTPDEGTRS